MYACSLTSPPYVTDSCAHKDGKALDAFFLLQERLRNTPLLALSVFLPSGSRQWIAVESTSMKNVHDLCFNVFTIPHPVEISLVPVEERISYLQWGPTYPRVQPTSWARLKRLPALKELNVEKNVWKYAGDLAFVLDMPSVSTARLCLVPRLSVRIEADGEKAKKTKSKRLPRLLHPQMIGQRPKDCDIAHPMKPGVWWAFGERLELERINGGLYKFAKGPKGDSYMPPFAISSVPILALQVAGIAPKLNELRVFHEGMAVGSCQLKLLAPAPDFMRRTYERYVAAPLEVGNYVEVKMEPGWVRGVVVDARFDELAVRVEDREDLDIIDAPAHNVRRYYRIGDGVKVIHASNICREGFVGREGFIFNINGELVEVLDCKDKETV